MLETVPVGAVAFGGSAGAGRGRGDDAEGASGCKRGSSVAVV